MSYNDLRGKISQHYIIFGDILHLESLIQEIRFSSKRTICFISTVKKTKKSSYKKK
jgi:hypothetical protein